MADVTAILTAYRRPGILGDQVEAIRAQTALPGDIWLWANDPGPAMLAAVARAGPDRVVASSVNAHVHARFALALSAPTEFVALFDDDTIPGPRWLENCLEIFGRAPGILGSAGVRLRGRDYSGRSVHGWHDPSDEAVEVDLVGQAWFLPTAWVHHLFTAPALTGTNGEDIELAARAWRREGVRSYCPPHPPGDRDRWGSLRGVELGGDQVALSRRPGHLAERDRIVRAEMEAGWRPLFMRGTFSRESDEHDSIAGGQHAGRPPRETRPENDPRPPIAAVLIPVVHPADDLEPWPSPGDLPAAARRILLIGDGLADRGRVLREGRGLTLVGIERDPAALDRGRGILDEIHAAASEGDWPDFADASFDAVLCGDLLGTTRRPGGVLRRIRRWLTPDGRLYADVANARRHEAVESLLGGRWSSHAEGGPGRRSIRFFTRREVEKLFDRAGFDLESVAVIPGPGHGEWVEAGRPGEAAVGSLRIGGLAPEEAEEFFAARYRVEATPSGRPGFGMTSIVILTHDQLDYTRQCLDSIRRLTDEPYELIVVDNASFDGTLEYLRAQPDVRLIANAENRGFPAAANQGIAAASGCQVLLLNNDTVVTSGWLRRMLRALHRDPDLGLVGPSSNRVSGEQQVPVTYEDVAGLDGFAWEWGKARDGVVEETDRLVGFCLLIRREALDAIGGLDERFGIGCFEDDDFCRRATLAGFRAAIARDAFVHHYGGTTFAAVGVDFAELMRENGRRFLDKWGDEEPRPSAGVPPGTPKPARPDLRAGRFAVDVAPGGGLLLRREEIRLSLCMIVRDSARTLPACLESIRPWVDEMVVVDTGSTDETVEVIRRYGGRVYHFPWCDDFSAARNESLRHARGRWLFWMDSDDTIPAECGRRLRELAYSESDTAVLGHVVQVHCPGGDRAELDVTAVDHVKLIRNRPTLRFEGRIHEQILPAIRREGGEVAWTDIHVVHSGSDRSEEGQERKRRRDLRLLDLELKERPDHPFTLFNLGMTHADGGRSAEAADFLERSIARSGEGDSHLRKAYALLAYARMRLGQHDLALDACRGGLALCPGDSELKFREGVVLHELGRLEEAERAYLDVLAGAGPRHFASVDLGIRGFKAHQNLAVVYADMGDLARSERRWRQVVREAPWHKAGWRGLGEVILRRGKQDEAVALAEDLIRGDEARVEGRLLRARVAASRGDHAAALRELETASGESPDDPEPLRAIGQILFESGRPEEAGRVLRRLVEVDPSDASAQFNLGTVHLRSRQFREAASCYRESIRLRPESAPTHLHLGYALKEAGRLHEAVAAWREARRLAPEDPAIRQELLWAERHGLAVGGTDDDRTRAAVVADR